MLEVIVALAIAALALGFAFPAISESLGRLRQDRDTAVALAVARSTLDRIGHEIPLRPGRFDGRADDRMEWQVTIAAYDAVVPAPDAGLAGLRVAVAVRWQQAGQPREVTLRTVRLAAEGGT